MCMMTVPHDEALCLSKAHVHDDSAS